MSERVFLTGFMGAGKTTVGRLLASRLDWEFLDLDLAIERGAGLAIPRIFSEKGEDAFRDLESRALRAALEGSSPARGLVIALGGGTLLRRENREDVLKSGFLVYLDASFESLRERLEGQLPARPLLRESWPKSCGALFDARKPGYETASLRIETDGKDPQSVAGEIAACLTAREASS